MPFCLKISHVNLDVLYTIEVSSPGHRTPEQCLLWKQFLLDAHFDATIDVHFTIESGVQVLLQSKIITGVCFYILLSVKEANHLHIGVKHVLQLWY